MAGPELTPDTTGNPFVEVFFDPDDLDPDAVLLRMYRISEGRTWLVRGGVDVAPGVAALDWECPFGVEASYRAEQFDVDGFSLGYTDSSEVTLEVDSVWVHNPLEPTGGVGLGSAALIGWSFIGTRPTVGGVVYTEDGLGRRIGSRRRGLVGTPLGFAVETLADADLMQAMLGTYTTQMVGVLCVRTPGPVRIPRTLFVSVDDPEDVSVDVDWGGERTNFMFIGTEVEPPHPGLVVPLLTYDDLDAAYADYDLRDAAYATYTEQDRDYSLAGLAG